MRIDFDVGYSIGFGRVSTGRMSLSPIKRKGPAWKAGPDSDFANFRRSYQPVPGMRTLSPGHFGVTFEPEEGESLLVVSVPTLSPLVV